MNSHDKGCETQLLANLTQIEKWDIDRLGEFAATEHQSIIAGETSLAPRYWRLGAALNFARKQVRHGKWTNFLKSHGIEKTRAAKARAIHRTFDCEQSLEGLTVDQAYAHRARRGNNAGYPSTDSIAKLASYLQGLRQLTQDVAADASWTNPDSLADLVRDVDQAIDDLEQIRRILNSPPAARG